MAKFIEKEKSLIDEFNDYHVREITDSTQNNNILYIYFEKPTKYKGIFDFSGVDKTFGRIEYIEPNYYVFTMKCANGWYVQKVEKSLTKLRNFIVNNYSARKYICTTSKKWVDKYIIA